MTNNENTNLIQVFKTFDHFVDMYESDDWLKTVTHENVISSFKCASLVEKTVEKVESFDNFLNALNVWFKNTKNRTKTYDAKFYSAACDHLLKKYLSKNCNSESCLEVALRMYIAFTSQERLEIVLADVLLHAECFQAIERYMVVNADSIDAKTLEAKLVFNDWLREFGNGRREKIKSTVNSMLNSYKIDKTLSVLIRMLAIECQSTLELQLQEVIMESLQVKMNDRSLLTKCFWTALFKSVSSDALIAACTNNRTFLESFLSFLIYLVTMLNLENDAWVIDVNSVCTEISYRQIVKILRLMHSHGGLRDFVRARITEAKNAIGTPIWLHVEKKICV